MEGRDLTGRGRHVLRLFQVVCGTRLRMRHMGGQCPQERWTFRHDAPPCMPVPVEASLVSFGVPKPTRQSEVLLEAWSCVSPHKESCGHAGHPPSHVAGKRGGEASECLWQARALALALRGRTVRTCSAGPRHARSLAPAAGRRGVLPAPFAPGYTWVPLNNMPLGCNGHALLFARLAAIEDIERLGRKPL